MRGAALGPPRPRMIDLRGAWFTARACSHLLSRRIPDCTKVHQCGHGHHCGNDMRVNVWIGRAARTIVPCSSVWRMLLFIGNMWCRTQKFLFNPSDGYRTLHAQANVWLPSSEGLGTAPTRPQGGATSTYPRMMKARSIAVQSQRLPWSDVDRSVGSRGVGVPTVSRVRGQATRAAARSVPISC